MSEHKVIVYPITLLPHPNADTLSLVQILGYTAVVRTADWKPGDLGAYIEPDYIVPADRPEFTWLAAVSKPITNNGITGFRVKCKKLRGIMSMGLLIKAPPGSSPGDDVMEKLGVKRYDPDTEITRGLSAQAIKGPPGFFPKYDVESIYRYQDTLCPDERVIITEKIHGANGRYCFRDGQMYCGSRCEWKLEGDSIWWRALTPEIRQWCENNQTRTLYGEVYGQVQDLKYGLTVPKFVIFDVLEDGHWLSFDAAIRITDGLPWVPILFDGLHKDSDIKAEGQSYLSLVPQIREGIVFKSATERTESRLGRVILKKVSNEYLERS